MRLRGFSLIELMLVVAIIGIMAAYAVPELRSMMDNQKMRSASTDLVSTVIQARSEAIKFGSTAGVSISIVPSTGAHLNDAVFSNGWCIVFAAAADCDVSNPGSAVMHLKEATEKVSYKVLDCSNTADCVISFGRSGRLAMGSLPVTIEIANDDTGNPMKRCVYIDLSGNAVVKRVVATLRDEATEVKDQC